MLDGILGCLIGLILFLAGYYFGIDCNARMCGQTMTYFEPPDPVETAKREQEQREYNKAVEEINSYDANKAYGI